MPDPLSGRFTGTVHSSTYGDFVDISDLTFDLGLNTLTGTATVTGVFTDQPVTGTFSCSTINFGVVAGATFAGTIDSDGQGASGTYTNGADTGTWIITYDETPLNVTQTINPTTIAPNAAASWVVSVHNPGPNPATGVVATFNKSAGAYGELDQFSGSGGCFFSVGVAKCNLGTVLPGATKSASGAVVATGLSGGATITANGSAAADLPDQDGNAAPVTISVVSVAELPAGEGSGVAQPGISFITAGGTKATPQNKIVVKFKLPKRVAAGTAMRLHHRRVQLMSYRPAALPRATTVKGVAVPMSISHTPAEASTFCAGPCTGDVIHFAPFSHYTDRKHPAKVTIIWDHSVLGRGTGSTIYKRGDSPQSPTTTLHICVKGKTGYTNLPCVASRKLIGGGDLQFLLLVLSGDPSFGRH